MSAAYSPDDEIRRTFAFLSQIEMLLSMSEINWRSIEYQVIPLYRRFGLVVTAPDMPGEAHILAVSIYNRRAIDYTHFPRQQDGRFPLSATVLLASYEARVPQARDRQMWLIAVAPKRRRDGQVLTLSLASLIGVNHAHRWDRARWLWDERECSASEETRWSVTGLELGKLGLERRAEHIAFFAERCAQPDPSLADRVSLCMLLQDEGRIEEAFALFDVDLTPPVLKILYGQPVSDGASSGHYSSMEDWAVPMLHALRHAAPWRFVSALETGKRCRLLWFPHQSQQRKASLMLTWANKKMRIPALEIEWTASNKLLAGTSWQRPLELDLLRFC